MSISQRLQEIREGFQPAFWVANVTEMFERLSYYGVYAVLAIYLHETLSLSEARAGDVRTPRHFRARSCNPTRHLASPRL